MHRQRLIPGTEKVIAQNRACPKQQKSIKYASFHVEINEPKVEKELE